MREVWVSTDVSSEPVSSAEAKLFAKIPSTADDTVVAYQIKSAREEVVLRSFGAKSNRGEIF